MSASALLFLLAAGGPLLTLDEAVATAQTHQPQLRQARASAQVAEARVDTALAPMLPQLSSSASYRRATSNFAPQPGQAQRGLTVESNSFATTDYWSFGVSATQLIYDFGQTTGRHNAAKASAEASRASEEAMRLQVLLNARAGFFAARANKELVRVAEQTLGNQRRHLEQVQGFVEVQTRPEIDLAQARLDMANAELQLINAQNGYATAKAQLNQVMGVVRDTEYDVADETLAPIAGEDASIDVLAQQAVNRPDIAALQKQIRAQELSIRATRGAYFPSVSASTSLTEAGPQLDRMAWNWNGSVNVSWQFFQGNLTRSQVREAEANLSVLHAQLEAAQQQVRLAIEQARLGIRAAKAAASIASVAVQNATRRLELAEGRYQAGVGSAIELGDAQLAFTNAQSQRVQAEYTLATARAHLLQALGRR
jgi:outer membrane protein